MSRRPPQECSLSELLPPLGDGTRADIVVELEGLSDADPYGIDLVRHAAEALPAPEALVAGAWLAARVRTPARKRLFGRSRHPSLSDRLARAACCTALTALGYERVCANESGTAFGRVPDS